MADRLAAQATVDDHIRKMLDLMKRGAHVSLTDIPDDPTFLMSHFSGSNAKEMAEKIEAKDAELEKLEAANEALDVEIDRLIRELESERATLASHTSALAEKDEEIARLREAAKRILPYLKWTISDESPGYHPTMPSAVASFCSVLTDQQKG